MSDLTSCASVWYSITVVCKNYTTDKQHNKLEFILQSYAERFRPQIRLKSTTDVDAHTDSLTTMLKNCAASATSYSHCDRKQNYLP